MKSISRSEGRARRHRRVRRKVSGNRERPRMSIMVSNRYMYVQFIDDVEAVTLASVTTQGIDGVKNNIDAARRLGKMAAQTALEKGIKTVVVDRGGFRFHGRVKAIVDTAAEAGLTNRIHPAKDKGVESDAEVQSSKEAK